jgi:hypothetical protein
MQSPSADDTDTLTGTCFELPTNPWIAGTREGQPEQRTLTKWALYGIIYVKLQSLFSIAHQDVQLAPLLDHRAPVLTDLSRRDG